MNTFICLLVAELLLSSAVYAQTQIFDNGAGLGNLRGSPIIEIIQNSRELAIEIYEMKDKSVKEALREAVVRGAKVRVLAEPSPFGSDKPDFDDLKALLGSKFKTFNKILCGQSAASDQSCFQHGKIILATENSGSKLALISTGNFNATNLCNIPMNPGKCNRDYTLVTKDKKIIALLSEIFEADYKGKRYDLRGLMDRHAEAAKRLTVSPFSKKPLLEFIDSAKAGCRLQVENQYMKDPELTAALMQAGRRGVKVEMTLASPCSFGPLQGSQIEDGDDLSSKADAAGVKVKYFTADQEIHKQDGYMHAKAMVITDCPGGSAARAWVGSVNGSTMSADYNREFGLFLEERAATRLLSDIMDWDHHDRDSATWKELKNSCQATVSASNTDAPGDRGFLQ